MVNTNKQVAKAIRKDPELQELLFVALKNREGVNDKFVPKCTEAIRKIGDILHSRHGIYIVAYLS